MPRAFGQSTLVVLSGVAFCVAVIWASPAVSGSPFENSQSGLSASPEMLRPSGSTLRPQSRPTLSAPGVAERPTLSQPSLQQRPLLPSGAGSTLQPRDNAFSAKPLLRNNATNQPALTKERELTPAKNAKTKALADTNTRPAIKKEAVIDTNSKARTGAAKVQTRNSEGSAPNSSQLYNKDATIHPASKGGTQSSQSGGSQQSGSAPVSDERGLVQTGIYTPPDDQASSQAKTNSPSERGAEKAVTSTPAAEANGAEKSVTYTPPADQRGGTQSKSVTSSDGNGNLEGKTYVTTQPGGTATAAPSDEGRGLTKAVIDTGSGGDTARTAPAATTTEQLARTPGTPTLEAQSKALSSVPSITMGPTVTLPQAGVNNGALGNLGGNTSLGGTSLGDSGFQNKRLGGAPNNGVNTSSEIGASDVGQGLATGGQFVPGPAGSVMTRAGQVLQADSVGDGFAKATGSDKPGVGDLLSGVASGDRGQYDKGAKELGASTGSAVVGIGVLAVAGIFGGGLLLVAAIGYAVYASGLGGAIADGVSSLVQSIFGAAYDAGTAVANTGVGESLIDNVEAGVSAIGDGATAAFEAASDNLESAASSVGDALSGAVEAVGDAASSAADSVGSFFSSLVEFVVDTVTAAVGGGGSPTTDNTSSSNTNSDGSNNTDSKNDDNTNSDGSPKDSNSGDKKKDDTSSATTDTTTTDTTTSSTKDGGDGGAEQAGASDAEQGGTPSAQSITDFQKAWASGPAGHNPTGDYETVSYGNVSANVANQTNYLTGGDSEARVVTAHGSGPTAGSVTGGQGIGRTTGSGGEHMVASSNAENFSTSSGGMTQHSPGLDADDPLKKAAELIQEEVKGAA